MHLSFIPNTLLRLFKYPIAVLCAGALPFTWHHLWASPLWSGPQSQYLWFLIGFSLYIMGWLLLFRRPMMGSYLSTFEHELTHAIFAWLTFHQVTGLKATWRSGGHCTFRGSGGGNWLIAIAPYWVPTLTIPIIFYQYITEQQSPTTQFLIGLTSAYHLTSTWRETHLKQPDLHQTGFVFALLFLPTANLVMYGFVTMTAICGLDAGAQFMHQVLNDTLDWAVECLSLSS